jgi:signal transduction histidine kinase
MAPLDLVERLAALRNLASIPREELAWLVAHGDLEAHPAGAVVGPKGQRIRSLWIILSGRISVRVDRGAGPKRVITWDRGEVTGMLPYSRMTGPPGDNILEEAGELLTVHERHFPELILRCPVFTAYTVHLMVDRARGFNASDLEDEKMISLGKLAAGLAHELNNPASAAARGRRLLLSTLDEADDALRELRAPGLNDRLFDAIHEVRRQCNASPDSDTLSTIQLADRQDAIGGWLVGKGVNDDFAAALAETPVTIAALEGLATASGPALEAALRWIVATCSERAIAVNIEQAVARIFGLVDAVKRFTYMDNLAAPEGVDVGRGLRDTVDILASKVSTKEATVRLDVDPNLPRVHASGAALNQVWFTLVDNALDAVMLSGAVVVSAHREADRVVVRVSDNGPGIPTEALSQIFDPFFTTKPPGQGVGLGLDIARRLVRQHHGDIAVRSVPGQTEFEVSLPLDE